MSDREQTHGYARDHMHRHATGSSSGCAREATRVVIDTACCGGAAGAAGQTQAATSPLLEGGEVLLLSIPAMDCPVEEGQIRRVLEAFPAIRRLRFDLPARTLALDAPRTLHEPIVEAIAAAGFAGKPIAAPPAPAQTAQARRAEWQRLAAALAAALLAELMGFLAPDTLPWRMASMGIAALAIGLAGVAVFRKGTRALRRGQLDINALMAVAVSGAFLIGQWPEAAMVMALYSLAELIEARSIERARDAISGLLALSPPRIELRHDDGSWLLADAIDAPVGAMARVRPGERFALDGRVVAGCGAVDQSPVTGESMPVDKGPGDQVFAGTINQGSALEFEVTAGARDTVLAQIIDAVEQAQEQRAPTQRLVDRFAAIYTPAVFVLALAVAVGAPLALGWPWVAAIYKALVLLVIACPCALVISTPVTVVSALAAAARRGILIKGGAWLEEAGRLRTLAVDKTGTVTEGRPRLAAAILVDDAVAEASVWPLARGLASRSDHPVSVAIAAGLAGGDTALAEDLVAEPGRGVRARVGERELVLGNHRWIEERGQCSERLEALLAEQETQGRTVAVLADAERVLALFAVSDTIRPSSARAVAELAALGVRTVMLTGDNHLTAQRVAAEAGIDEVQAELLPQDKLERISRLAAHGPVGMVGDGINDAPALAAANVGFAMGGTGTDIAGEAADVLVMNDDLRRIPETIALSRRAHRVLWQNISLALGIKFAFLVLALLDHATMWMAVFADVGASLLVIGNGLRMLRPGWVSHALARDGIAASAKPFGRRSWYSSGQRLE